MTEFGEVALDRNLYQTPGADGLAPLDAAMKLPEEKYSYEVRRIVAEESAKSSFDEVVELIEKHTGASVPKRQVEELAVPVQHATSTISIETDSAQPRTPITC
jgi:hypothetical protein